MRRSKKEASRAGGTRADIRNLWNSGDTKREGRCQGPWDQAGSGGNGSDHDGPHRSRSLGLRGQAMEAVENFEQVQGMSRAVCKDQGLGCGVSVVATGFQNPWEDCVGQT